MKKDSITNHFPTPALQPDNSPLVSPIYQSVKFSFKNFAELEAMFNGERDGYFYSRYRNPTVRELELLLAKLQGTENGLATASGISAISATLLALLKAGDQVVYFIESYKPTRVLLENILGKFGVKGIKLSLHDEGAIETALRSSETKLMIWESPTNPQLLIPNNERLVELAKQHQVISVLDNTFAGFHNNADLGADIYVHSLTKYAGGHGDVMGGVILSTDALTQQILTAAVEIGAVLDPHAAFLILRGMKTYHLRYERQSSTALALAQWLSKLEQVEQVFYPGLQSDTDLKGGGCVLMFNLRDKETDIRSLFDKLELFKVSASLGSTESLIAPAMYFYAGDLNQDELVKANIDQTSIRLSIGLEELSDLQADLEQAFQWAS